MIKIIQCLSLIAVWTLFQISCKPKSTHLREKSKDEKITNCEPKSSSVGNIQESDSLQFTVGYGGGKSTSVSTYEALYLPEGQAVCAYGGNVDQRVWDGSRLERFEVYTPGQNALLVPENRFDYRVSIWRFLNGETISSDEYWQSNAIEMKKFNDKVQQFDSYDSPDDTISFGEDQATKAMSKWILEFSSKELDGIKNTTTESEFKSFFANQISKYGESAYDLSYWEGFEGNSILLLFFGNPVLFSSYDAAKHFLIKFSELPEKCSNENIDCLSQEKIKYAQNVVLSGSKEPLSIQEVSGTNDFDELGKETWKKHPDFNGVACPQIDKISSFLVEKLCGIAKSEGVHQIFIDEVCKRRAPSASSIIEDSSIDSVTSEPEAECVGE